MKQKLNLTASLLVVLALAGCQKDVQHQSQDNSVAPMAKAPGTSTGSGTVYLSVTIDDTSPNQVLSDGNPYTNGTDRVEAQILSSDGNFYMNTNNNTVKAPLRTMHFPFNSTLDGKRNYSLRTAVPADASVNGGTTYWIQNMPVPSTQYMSFRIWGVQQSGVVDWKLLFRNGPENNTSSSTDYVKISRLSDTEWILEPANLAPVAAAARLVDGNNNPLGLEFYQVPFRLTLKRIN